jgi:hypothetical protein
MGFVEGSVPVERRAVARFPFPPHGSNPLVATVGLFPRCALVLDLSTRGIALLVPWPPPVGSVIPVWVAGRRAGPSPLLLVAVVYVLPQDGLYRVGGHFVDEASAEAARALLPLP